MSGPNDEIWQALQAADALPPGRARIERLEELVVAADAARDPERGTAARLSLVPAYLYGGRHREIAPALTWLLQRYDEEPAWFGPWERQAVLFSFTWATSALLPHPDVPLAQIEAALADMSARYNAAGESMTPTLKARYELAAHRHGHAAADEAYHAWVANPRSELSDCEFCEPAEQVRHLAAVGRHDEAVALALPVLDSPAECKQQQFATIAVSMESLLLTGHEERALREHLRGVRLLRMARDDGDDAVDAGAARHPDQAHGPIAAMPGRAEHLMLLARTGRLERGLDLLEAWMPWLGSGAASGHQVMVTTAAGARLLRGVSEAGGGDVPIPTGRWGEVSAERLGSRLAGRARELASRFDARNGTGGATGLVEDLLSAGPLPDLPLDPLGRSSQFARLRTPSAAAGEGPGRRRGRRAATDEAGPQELADAGDLVALADAFREASRADALDRQAAVLAVWRSARPSYAALPEDDVEGTRAAARLDGWLAVADLEEPAGDVEAARTAAAEAATRLRGAGLSVQALLHEQACVLATARIGRIDAAEAMTRVGKTAAQVAAEGSPGEVGLAYCRLALAREAVARAGMPEPGDQPEPGPTGNDPVEAAIAALTSVEVDQLDHQQRRALTRMLRLRSVDEPDAAAVETLRAAEATLPDGVRPLERAMARSELATRLAPLDPAESLRVWRTAIDDAITAGAAGVLGNLLAASATVRYDTGDPDGAADDLARAIPLLDEHSPGPLPAQARTDLARALLAAGRSIEAAEASESSLADLSAQVNELERQAPLDYDDAEPEMLELIHLAGTAAFVAAEAAAVLGDVVGARALAARSAAWHRRNRNLLAQSEAWQLAARAGGPPGQVIADLQRATDLAEQAGEWDVASTCRRERIAALQASQGPEAALVALAEADEALQRWASRSESGRRAHLVAVPPITDPAGGSDQAGPAALERGRRIGWHRTALAEQRARVLALLGRFAEALEQVEGLEESYRLLGDDASARELLGLSGQLRAELGDLDTARADLLRAAEEARSVMDAGQTHGLGQRLAAVLDEAGLPDEAEDAWTRFCTEEAFAPDDELDAELEDDLEAEFQSEFAAESAAEFATEGSGSEPDTEPEPSPATEPDTEAGPAPAAEPDGEPGPAAATEPDDELDAERDSEPAVDAAPAEPGDLPQQTEDGLEIDLRDRPEPSEPSLTELLPLPVLGEPEPQRGAHLPR